MELQTRVKLATYQHFATTGRRPDVATIAGVMGASADEVRSAFAGLRSERVLLLEADGETIRMAPPFSGVPTPHRVEVDGRRYYANCAWDALGIPAALHRRGTVRSCCGQSGAPLHLDVGLDGPGPSDWLFHCLVPAARWWDDLVYT